MRIYENLLDGATVIKRKSFKDIKDLFKQLSSLGFAFLNGTLDADMHYQEYGPYKAFRLLKDKTVMLTSVDHAKSNKHRIIKYKAGDSITRKRSNDLILIKGRD